MKSIMIQLNTSAGDVIFLDPVHVESVTRKTEGTRVGTVSGANYTVMETAMHVLLLRRSWPPKPGDAKGAGAYAVQMLGNEIKYMLSHGR